MSCKVYFNKTLFPVVPEKITMKIKGKNETVTLINSGEVNILKSPGLTEVSFDLLLPSVKYPFAVYKNNKFQKPEYYLKKLEAFKLKKKSFQLIITRRTAGNKIRFNTNLTVALEDYEIKEEAKQCDDITVSIKLKQYIPYQIKTVKKLKSKTGTKTSKKKKRASSKNSGNKKYIVKKGDCLWNIAKRFYDDSTKYTLIYIKNKSVIENTAKKHGLKSSSGGHWIYPGTEITIPEDV